MNIILKKKKISEIEMFYDIFLFDLYGVTHNGVNLFPDILNILKNLKKLNKKVVFISNAPRKSLKIKKFLKNLGLDQRYYFDLVSSGDVTYEDYLKKLNGEKYYFIGNYQDKSLCRGLKVFEINDLEKANFILNTGPYNGQKVENYIKILKKGALLSLEMICANPDLEVIRGSKKEICAGALALKYEKLGGKVKYFGKPFKKIYQKSLKRINSRNKKRILAIGDSIRTDILGANNFGIDSALVLSGIDGNIKGIEKLCKKTNIYPKFLFNKLQW